MLAFAAQEFRVKYTPGRVCDGQAHMLRVSFAFYKDHELQEGAKRLAAAVKAYTKAGKQP
jgi:DNA-binding transcriptional MocR family regulator